MHFYKTKFDAASPMRQQLNVPTNTDFMVGTELYVKGEKKNITTENVKISPSPKQYLTETITLTFGAENEWATWNTSSKYWTIKKPFTVKPHYYVQSGAYVENKLYTDISYGGYYDEYSNYGMAINVIKNSSGTNIGNTQRLSKNDVETYGLTSQYYLLMGPNGWASEFTFEEGMRIYPLAFKGVPVEFDLVFTNKVETGILAPDTEVNGIPAFTMKSLDAEADKLYDVEFSGSNTNVTWNDALTAYNQVDGDLFQFDTLASNKFKFTVLKEITIKAPFTFADGKYIDLGNDFTNLAATDRTGNSVFGGELAYAGNYLQLSSSTDGMFNVWYCTTSDLTNLGYKKSSNYTITNTSGSYVESVTLKPGDIIQINKATPNASPRFWYFQIGPEAYNYRFKLFINEDEQAYGDVQVGQEFENTITLSGTYEDDTTFSYTIPVVEG